MAKKPKRAKTPKAPKGRGSNGGGKDLVTGLYWEIEGVGRISNDKPINITHEQALRIHQKTLTAYGQRVDSENGIEALPPPGDIFPIQIEVEIASQQMVRTIVDSRGNVGRDVITGEFSFAKGRLTQLKVYEIAASYVVNEFGYEYGEIQAFSGGKVISNPNNFYSIDLELTGKGQEIGSYYLSDSDSQGDRTKFAEYDSRKFFYEGWENNPFASNLI